MFSNSNKSKFCEVNKIYVGGKKYNNCGIFKTKYLIDHFNRMSDENKNIVRAIPLSFVTYLSYDYTVSSGLLATQNPSSATAHVSQGLMPQSAFAPENSHTEHRLIDTNILESEGYYPALKQDMENLTKSLNSPIKNATFQDITFNDLLEHYKTGKIANTKVAYANLRDFLKIRELIDAEPSVEFVDKDETECPICFEAFNDTNFSVTKCGHKFHTECLLKSITNSNVCPKCRECVIEGVPPKSKKLTYVGIASSTALGIVGAPFLAVGLVAVGLTLGGMAIKSYCTKKPVTLSTPHVNVEISAANALIAALNEEVAAQDAALLAAHQTTTAPPNTQISADEPIDSHTSSV